MSLQPLPPDQQLEVPAAEDHRGTPRLCDPPWRNEALQHRCFTDDIWKLWRITFAEFDPDSVSACFASHLWVWRQLRNANIMNVHLPAASDSHWVYETSHTSSLHFVLWCQHFYKKQLQSATHLHGLTFLWCWYLSIFTNLTSHPPPFSLYRHLFKWYLISAALPAKNILNLFSCSSKFVFSACSSLWTLIENYLHNITARLGLPRSIFSQVATQVSMTVFELYVQKRTATES